MTKQYIALTAALVIATVLYLVGVSIADSLQCGMLGALILITGWMLDALDRRPR